VRLTVEGKVFSFLNNLAVGGTLLLRSREIDGLKLAIGVRVSRENSYEWQDGDHGSMARTRRT
jgi:hypothetical protein